MLNEVEEAREQLRIQTKQHEIDLKDWSDKVIVLEQSNQTYNTQINILQKDLSKYQEAARSAYQNYERELQLHATAEQQLRLDYECICVYVCFMYCLYNIFVCLDIM